MVIPKHFVPPIMVNALLGSVLWTVYAETSSSLDPYIGHHPTLTAAISGAVAGGAQALVAAPAENVRMVLEGGKLDGHSWSYAWKEVFRSTRAAPVTSKAREIEEAREVRTWMREVGEMAGRGWDGWGWGCAKDICGRRLPDCLILLQTLDVRSQDTASFSPSSRLHDVYLHGLRLGRHAPTAGTLMTTRKPRPSTICPALSML